jgi:DnaJ homolog subfamily A member 1
MMASNNFRGIQVIRERKVLEVHVDKGMQDGQKIMFSGEGDQEPGLEPGDIVIVLDEKEHQIFR